MRDAWDGLIRDFVRHLKGTNRAATTQRIYRRAAEGLVDFLEESDELSAPGDLRRRHVEGYIGHLIETRSPSTANVVYRALQQFMKWLLDEEIDRSPMERMKPPIVPEKPIPVLTETQLRTLLAGAKSNSHVDPPDNAIMRLLIDTRGPVSQGAGLPVEGPDFHNKPAPPTRKGPPPPAPPP